MTQRQAELLSRIDGFQRRFGYSPDYRWLAREMGLKSTSGIHRLVWALVEQGKLRVLPYRKRTIEVV